MVHCIGFSIANMRVKKVKSNLFGASAPAKMKDHKP